MAYQGILIHVDLRKKNATMCLVDNLWCAFSWGCYVDRITATPVVTGHDGSQIPRDRLVTVIRLLLTVAADDY
jgi:hypothetical protein